MLIAIAHLAAEGDVNVKTVADHLHLSGAFITSTTRRLLQLGLIRKTMDTVDRRRVTVTVARQGMCGAGKARPAQRRVNDVNLAA